ncbi:MAG: HIT family protein [Anaerolineae bacterium]
MKRLWTPWRMEYLVSEKHDGCVFCEKMASDADRENLVLHRSQHACIMLNLYPYNTGHLMIIPREHAPSLEDLDAETRQEIMDLINLSLRILRRALRPDGFNIGVNIGRAAGAGISEHVHVHIVPRWEGDTNFMPIMAETRVMPELLTQTYDKLKAVLAHEQHAG